MLRSACLSSLLSRNCSGPAGRSQQHCSRVDPAVNPCRRRGGPPAGEAGGRYGRALSGVPAGRSTVVDSVTESTLAREKKMGK